MSIHVQAFMPDVHLRVHTTKDGRPRIELGTEFSIHSEPGTDASEQWRNLADAALECYRIAERNRIGSAPTALVATPTRLAPPCAGDRVRHRSSLRQGVIESVTRNHITVAYDSIGLQAVAPDVFDHHFIRLGAQEAMAL